MALIDLGSGVKYEATTTGSGTGNYDSFLRLADNGDEQGYNTDANGQLDNKDGIWTHKLLISSLAVINVGGIDYYEIRLDLNEIQSGNKPNISLDELQIYYGAAAGAGAYPSFSGLTKVFDLEDPLALVDTNHGSGTDDYRFLLPTSLFPSGAQYLTLFADFSGSDDGFEEFRVQTTEFVPQPDIGVLKETNGTDDECPEILAGGDVTWTYTVENNGNIPLTNVVVMDDNGTPGDTTDDVEATYVSGDTSNIGVLDTDETWIFTASGTALAGEYANIATVTADYSYDDGEGGSVTGSVNGSEEDCYYGVTPTIAIVKYTNDQDNACANILVGESVVWTYEVTNTSDGDVYIDGIIITDDAGTPGDTSPESDDDFSPTAVLAGAYNVGDTDEDNQLDVGETWLYTATLAGGAVAGEYLNTATVNGTAHDAFSNTAPVDDDETDCYFGADPSIDIIKKTNGTDDLCPVVTVGSTVTWTYFVENTGNVALTNIVIRDDNGTPDPATGDDITPTAVLSGAYNAGDLNLDGVFDPGEIWQYSATGVAEEGEYDNVAYVSADYTDDFQNATTVNASENDCYLGVEGPGVRTPGFWSNWQDFWDGDLNVPRQATEDCFADYDLLRIDSSGDGVIDGSDTGFSNNGGTLGLFIGDYDRSGTADADEDVVFISLTDALNLINASTKQMNDGVVKIGRDTVASWLNYLAGNPIGTVDGTDGHYSPREAIDDAVDYLQIFGDSDNSVPGGNQNNPAEIFDVYSSSHRPVKTSSAFWSQDFPGGGHSGAEIHAALDEYNNFGTVDGFGYAHDCDTPQFLSSLAGFSLQEGSYYYY